MTRQRIDNLGAAGLNTDIFPTLLPPGSWTGLVNVTPRDNAIYVAAGRVLVANLPCKPTWHMVYTDSTGTTYLVLSDGASVWLVNTETGAKQDISPALPRVSLLSLNFGRVSFTSLNGVLVVNSATNGPFYWPGSGVLLPLPGWQSGWLCQQMVAYRYFLVALNMTETAALFPYKVRWSSSAAEGEIPAEWIPATTNDAGDDLLGETPGHIVQGVVIRDSLHIVTEDSAYRMSWIGGQSIMRTDRLHGSLGTTLPTGAVEMGGALVSIKDDDIVAFDGTQARSLANGRVRKVLKGMLGWIGTLHAHNEDTTLCLMSAPNGSLSNIALMYDWTRNVWWQRDITNGFGFDSLDGDLIIYEWESGAQWKAYRLTGSPDRDGVAERRAVLLEGSDNLVMLREAWLECDGGPVDLTIGTQSAPDGAITWGSPNTWTPGTTRSIPLRVTGRYFAVRLSLKKGAPCTVGAITLDWAPAGER